MPEAHLRATGGLTVSWSGRLKRASVRKERVECVAGEEVVEAPRPPGKTRPHSIRGACLRRREAYELDVTSALRTMVVAGHRRLPGLSRTVSSERWARHMTASDPAPIAADWHCSIILRTSGREVARDLGLPDGVAAARGYCADVAISKFDPSAVTSEEVFLGCRWRWHSAAQAPAAVAQRANFCQGSEIGQPSARSSEALPRCNTGIRG